MADGGGEGDLERGHDAGVPQGLYEMFSEWFFGVVFRLR